MKASELQAALYRGDFDKAISGLYRTPEAQARQRTRYRQLAETFLEMYGDREVRVFSVPGRTEISGNHTDHNNGKVLAASVDLDIIAIASATADNTIRMKSAGYREDVVSCHAEASSCKKGTSGALVAGVCDGFRRKGYQTGGFVACTTSDVMSGSGLSSSAAFEVMVGRILSGLYNNGSVPAMQLAIAGQYAENVYFGKPCGLMDQAACANGGFLYIDFADPSSPKTEKLQFDPETFGYTFCILNTGGSHVDLTDDYAAVPKEMHAVAHTLGKSVLRECDKAAFLASLPALRKQHGDRAVLRAMHFFAENDRVEEQRNALRNGDGETFFRLVSASGNSSFKYLQNVFSAHRPAEQGISLALALCEQEGAVCRVHGGGFAGTVQAYIPKDKVGSFRQALDGAFGQGACMFPHIRPYGAAELTVSGVAE